MAIRDMMADGIGFAPGSVKFIPMRGLASAAVTAATGPLVSPAQTLMRLTRVVGSLLMALGG